MNRTIRFVVAAIFAMAPAVVQAQECASGVSDAQNAARTQYINGMSGLANNNFSHRPGTYTSMACLDKFMQGNMDTFFRPPGLNDLLQQALSFACQQLNNAITGDGANGQGGQTQVLALLQSISGGLSVPSSSGGSSTVSAASFLDAGVAAPTGNMTSLFTSLFGGK